MGAGGAASVANQDGSSFSDISSENDLIARLASGSDSIDLLIDYSDFKNFVTFNSADSYVTITADQILSEYPAGGSVDDLQAFTDSLDGYQQYFLGLWPSRVGHLRLNPAVSSSYVSFNDFGVQDGVARSSFISPGTGSLSIQGWIDVPVMTGSNDVSVVFNKQKVGSTDAIAVYVSGSSLFFNVISGSTTSTVSGTLGAMPQFFAAVLDRSAMTGTISLYTSTTGTYPSLQDSTIAIYGSRFDLNSGSYYIGSGSVAGKVVRPFTGSLDDITVWAAGRNLSNLSGTFNRKVYAQSTLLAAYRFNDASPRSPKAYGSIVHDSSGHRLDGRVQQYFSGSRGSGSLAFDVPDPIVTLDDPDVIYYVVQAHTTGVLYDRNNTSLVYNLFPEAFTSADPTSSDVFKNFALIMARHFDRVKLYVNQLANLRRVNYDEFDQAPDELLEEVGRYFGWSLQGSFVTTDSLRYFVGRDVYAGAAGNNTLNTRLADIKNQFWRRLLQNLPYVYKTKGTRESVEALLRSYGVDNGFVRLKEYARKTESRLPTARVESEKSVYSAQFSSLGNFVSVSFDAPLATINQAGLVLIVGDSNGVGQEDTDHIDRGLNLLTPFTGVLNNARIALSTADPPVFTVITSSFLAPYGPGGSPGAGVELTLGRDLYSLGMTPYIGKFAINGTTAGDYAPTGSYPSTGGNLSARLKNYINEMQVSSSLPLKAVVLSLSTNDAGQAFLTSSYQGNITAIMSDIRASFGSNVVFVLPKLNIACSLPFVSTIRTAQIALAAADPTRTRLVNQDDLAMSSDGLHYALDGYSSQGQRFARAISDMLAVSPRTVTTAYPQWVGADAGFYGTGTMFPRPWAGETDGDFEILNVTNGLANSPISFINAQGFTPITSNTSLFSGLFEKQVLYSRTVSSASFVNGMMPIPVISGSNSLNSARIHVFRGPTGVPIIDTFTSASNNANGVSLTIPAITASNANELIATFVGGYSGNGLNTVSIANGSLADLAGSRDSIYLIGSDSQNNTLVTGRVTGSGPTAVTTITTAFNAILNGISVALKSS